MECVLLQPFLRTFRFCCSDKFKIQENVLLPARKKGSSMKVAIKLIGTFQIGRFKEEVREYPIDTCVRKLVDELRIPTPLLGIVLINDIHAGVEDVLNEGDTVCLLPFIDGG
jgi:sulfur-carrier protein